MVETFATSQYREKFLGSLSMGQSLAAFVLAAPGILMAAAGYPAWAVLPYGLFWACACAGMAYFDLDERARLLLGFSWHARRIRWGTGGMEDFLGVEDIRSDAVFARDGRLLSVVKVFPKDLGGLSESDVERALAGYGTFLHELSSNIQIIMSSTEVDLEESLQRMRERVLLSGRTEMAGYFEHFAEYTRAVVESKTVADRDYYIVISGGKTQEPAKALSDLDARTRNLESSLRDAGIECRRLGTDELVGLYANFYSPRFRLEADAWSPVTFHHDMDAAAAADEYLRRYAGSGDGVFLRDAKARFSPGGVEAAAGSGDRRSFVLGQLMPSSIEILKDRAVVEKLHRVLFAVRFPAVVHPGWLTKLVRLPIDFDVVFHIHPLSQRTSAAYLQHELTKLETDVTVKAGEGLLVAERDRVNLQKVRELLGRVSRDEEKCFDVALYVDVKAYDGRGLDIAVMRLRDVLEGLGVQLRVADWEMGDALRSCYPLAEDRLGERRDRLFPSSAVRDSYPFILSGLEDRGDRAVVVGYNQLNGIPVLLDVFRQPNPHILVLGSSGSGKSFLVKKLLLCEAVQDVDIYVVDPHGEYGGLVEKMGGRVIRLAPGSGSSLNLFDIGCDTYDGRKAAAKAFFNIVRGCMDGELSGSSAGIVDRMVDAAYRKAGIFADDPSTWARAAPTFSDMHAALNQYASESSQESWKRASAEALLSALAPFVSGDLRYLDQATNVSAPDRGIASYDISGAGALRPQDRALSLFIVFDHIYSRLGPPGGNRRRMIVVDEAWSVFENNQDYLGPVVRCGRKRNLSVVMLDQNVEDLLAPDASGRPRGHVVLNNTSTKFILRQEAPALSLVAEKFALTGSQQAFVRGAGTGDVLMLTPTIKLPLYVLASDEEKALLSTSPEEPANPRVAGPSANGFDPNRDRVVPRSAVSDGDARRLVSEGYAEVADFGLGRGERSLYFVKAPQGEDPVRFLRKTLIRNHLQALNAGPGPMRMRCGLMPDIVFNVEDGTPYAVEVAGPGGLAPTVRERLLKWEAAGGKALVVAADEDGRERAGAAGFGDVVLPHEFIARAACLLGRAEGPHA
jgi:DNA helicase HerA-like ATPase